ncbi:MAG TPA: K(+)-transporting ATPase subunit F, partial [Nitrospirota bacterium]
VTASRAPLYSIRNNCSRGSAVFTPFLLPVLYYECGQVEEDRWTTCSLPSIEGYAHGSHPSDYCSDIFSAVRLAHLGIGSPVGGHAMNAMYILGGILSLGLLVYLMVALLKPEWF